MRDLQRFSRARRALFMALPAVLMPKILSAQRSVPQPPLDEPDGDIRLPSGKKQKDAIVKSDYDNNVKDAQELINVAKQFEENLEKDDRYVLSIASLKKLDDIEKLTRRIRGRLKRY